MTVQITSTIVRRPDSTFPVIVKPYKLDLSQIADKVRDEIKFTIRNVSDQKLSMKLVSGRADLFQVTLPESIEPGQTGEGVLTLTKAGIDTEFEKSFTFELDDETTTRFSVPVKRAIRNTMTSEPVQGYGGGK
jgi:hypothetical protein